MKASFIVGLVILVLIIMGAPLLVIPVHASAKLPTIHCWDGTTIGPVNGTYVAHCSPAPVCPHGESPFPDGTCLPPCSGSGNMSCMFKLYNDTQATIGEQFVYKTSLRTDILFNSDTSMCAQQGLGCYSDGLAAGSAHPGVCPLLYNNQSKQQQYCSGFKDGSSHPAVYDAQGAIVCDNESNTGCHWDVANNGFPPCVHGPPYIPDRNGSCPPPAFMQNRNHSVVSCGQIMCYDLGWNRGQDTGIVDQHCPAAVDTLPVSVDNTTIINREQVDAYCNGFSDGEQALANHPGVRSHVSSSMVLPHNSTGFSNPIKIMPNGSTAEIGHPHIINQTHTASPTTNITQREHLFIFPP
jgi:hypothetical protein